MKLYKFLENQGQNYRKLIEGKKSTLTVQRIRDLDEVCDIIRSVFSHTYSYTYLSNVHLSLHNFNSSGSNGK